MIALVALLTILEVVLFVATVVGAVGFVGFVVWDFATNHEMEEPTVVELEPKQTPQVAAAA